MIKIELRKIKHLKSLSEETPAYTAQVWVDGKHFCDTSNHGHGGCDMQHPLKGVRQNDENFYARLKALNEQIAREYPKIDCTTFGGTGTLDQDLEMICHELVNRKEVEDAVRRDLKRKVMFIHPKDGKIYSAKITTSAPGLIAAIKQKHGIAQTINEMPFEKAFELLTH